MLTPKTVFSGPHKSTFLSEPASLSQAILSRSFKYKSTYKRLAAKLSALHCGLTRGNKVVLHSQHRESRRHTALDGRRFKRSCCRASSRAELYDIDYPPTGNDTAVSAWPNKLYEYNNGMSVENWTPACLNLTTSSSRKVWTILWSIICPSISEYCLLLLAAGSGLPWKLMYLDSGILISNSRKAYSRSYFRKSHVNILTVKTRWYIKMSVVYELEDGKII